jgi:DNA-binding CsgD family transcriptional regulator
MNAALTTAAATRRTTTVAARTRSSQVAQSNGVCFVARLVASLGETFRLDANERELARQLLCGHPLGMIAKAHGVDTRTAQQLCRSLFGATGSDGRQQLFEIALRLTTMRELSSLFAGA